MKKTLLILFLALSTISSVANAKGDNDVVYVWEHLSLSRIL